MHIVGKCEPQMLRQTFDVGDVMRKVQKTFKHFFSITDIVVVSDVLNAFT